MPSALTLALTDAQRRTLYDAPKRHDKPYVSERAAALLKIDDGWSGRKVAREGFCSPGLPTPSTPPVMTGRSTESPPCISRKAVSTTAVGTLFPPEHSSLEEAREE